MGRTETFIPLSLDRGAEECVLIPSRLFETTVTVSRLECGNCRGGLFHNISAKRCWDRYFHSVLLQCILPWYAVTSSKLEVSRLNSTFICGCNVQVIVDFSTGSLNFSLLDEIFQVFVKNT